MTLRNFQSTLEFLTATVKNFQQTAVPTSLKSVDCRELGHDKTQLELNQLNHFAVPLDSAWPAVQDGGATTDEDLLLRSHGTGS